MVPMRVDQHMETPPKPKQNQSYSAEPAVHLTA
jgi:hypothetical protein